MNALELQLNEILSRSGRTEGRSISDHVPLILAIDLLAPGVHLEQPGWSNAGITSGIGVSPMR